jgi:hypothetical protein
MDATPKANLARDVFYPRPPTPTPGPSRAPEPSRAPTPAPAEPEKSPSPTEPIDYIERPCLVCQKVGDVVSSGYPLLMQPEHALDTFIFNDGRGAYHAWGSMSGETYVTMSLPLVEYFALYHGHLAGPCGDIEQP